MRHVTSVNVACGVHAGSAATMEHCVRLARTLGVKVGAHPGVSGSFGRGEVRLSLPELQTLLLTQVGALRRLTEIHRVRLHHVKLHGALYHAVEHDPNLGQCYVDTMARWFRGLPIYALAGGPVAALGRDRGVSIWEEAFLDRGYQADGTLIPRGEPNALLTRPREIATRLRDLRLRGGWPARDGSWLALRPRTLCVHGDTPGALRLLRTIRQEFSARP